MGLVFKETKEEIDRRANTYDCSGYCYGKMDCPKGTGQGICPLIDTCPETRAREWWATIISAIICAGFWIFIIVMFIMFIESSK